MSEPLSMFGGMRTDLTVGDLTKKIMKEYPVTYRSHRLLMLQAAREFGFKVDELPSDQRNLLETLFDLSPDFDRHARKVRADDEAKKPTLEDHLF